MKIIFTWFLNIQIIIALLLYSTPDFFPPVNNNTKLSLIFESSGFFQKN